MGGDEVELHFWSSAKYAKAFFRMSRSSVTVRRCCWSRRTLLGLGREAAGAGERRGLVGLAGELLLPVLEQAAGDAEIMGDLGEAPPAADEGDGVLLELRRERPADPGDLLGHGTLLESSYCLFLECPLFGVRSDAIRQEAAKAFRRRTMTMLING